MNKLIKWTCAVAAICLLLSAAVSAAEKPAERQIKKLIIKRTEVMESVLLGKITFDEGCRLLETIETGSLLAKDIDKFDEFRQTDIAVTENIEFVSLEQKTVMYDIASFEAEIIWTERYGNERCMRTCIYDVGAEKKDDKYKLTTFEIQRDEKTY